MNVLLIGGSGHVGTMTLPYMKSHHNFRVLDLSPPKDTSIDYIQGSVTDPVIVQEALKGMDTFVYMVMLQPTSDRSSVADFSDIVANYEVNAKDCMSSYTPRKRQAFNTPFIQARSLCMSGHATIFRMKMSCRAIIPVSTD